MVIYLFLFRFSYTWSDHTRAHEFSSRWIFHEHCYRSRARKQEFWGAWWNFGEILLLTHIKLISTGTKNRWLYQSVPIYCTASTTMSTRASRWITKSIPKSTTTFQATTHPQFNIGAHNFLFATVWGVTKLRKNGRFRRRTTRLGSENQQSSGATTRPGLSLGFDGWGEISFYFVYAAVHEFQSRGSFSSSSWTKTYVTFWAFIKSGVEILCVPCRKYQPPCFRCNGSICPTRPRNSSNRTR